MRNFTAVFIVFSVLFAFSSCKRSSEVGPAYRIASDNFYVVGGNVTTSLSSVDFETQTLSIDASFSEPVSWAITLKGLESGAVKTINGLSQNLNDHAVNIWNGSHDGLYFFQAGEQVVVELSFLGSSKVLRDTITINKVKKYSNQGIIVAKPSLASAYEGFEGPAFDFNTAFWNYGLHPDGDEMAGQPTDASTQRDTMNPYTGMKPIEGKYVMTFKGKDGIGPSDYYVGGMRRVIQASERALIPSDPSDVYVNIYVYGKGNTACRLNYGFIETDNDEFEKQIVLDHTGWKLFSFKYSELDKGFNAAGDDIKEPHTLSEVSFNLISSPAGNEVEVTFDYPIITFGAPFNPYE